MSLKLEDLTDDLNIDTNDQEETTTVTDENTQDQQTETNTVVESNESSESVQDVNESSADNTEQPVEQQPEENEAVVEEPAPVNEDSSEQQSESEPTLVQEVADNTVSTFDYLNRNGNKISNSVASTLSHPSIPRGKYMLFATNDEEDADLYLLENPDKLRFNDFEPTDIIVGKSGVIIKSDECRTYVGKTNVVQFNIEDGNVVKMTIFKKNNTKITIFERDDSEEVELDAVKLYIKNISPRLDSVVKDMTTKEEIKNATLAFMDQLKDINHLIKLDSEIMLKCAL